MVEAYYPRHSELDTPQDVQVDALQARVRLLEEVLRETATVFCSDARCNCPGYRNYQRIQQALEVAHA